MFRSLRARLTLWYVVCFTVLCAVFAVLLYGVLSRSMVARLDESLRSQAATAASLFQDEMQEENGDPIKAAAEVMADMRPGAARLVIIDSTRSYSSSAPFDEKPAAAQARAARQSEIVVGVPGARTAIDRVESDGAIYWTIAQQPLDSIAADLAAVRHAMLLALPLILALACAGGYIFTKRGLAPLNAMAEQARRIGGENLNQRIEIGPAAEELSVLAASFNELLARLDQSFEGMRRFVADASHELRTPLSVIRGEADVALGKDRDSAEYRAALAVILDESRRISRLIDDLLNLARADAGRVRLQVQEFYLNDLLADCCRSVQPLAASRNIALACRAPADMPFRGDEELLRRMTLNLLDNALRYTQPGGRVSADLESRDSAVAIRVSDTGPGIPPAAAPHIFERFYRADQSRPRDGGFGLGLAIVKWIAESHHGAVDLSTKPGAGSVFTVSLPK
jgi:heavy metal sensor kinase